MVTGLGAIGLAAIGLGAEDANALGAIGYCIGLGAEGADALAAIEYCNFFTSAMGGAGFGSTNGPGVAGVGTATEPKAI